MPEMSDLVYLLEERLILLLEAFGQGVACLLLMIAAIDYILYFVATFFEIRVLTCQFLIGCLETIDPARIFFKGFELLTRTKMF